MIVEMLLQAEATVDLQAKVKDIVIMIQFCSSVTCSVSLAMLIVLSLVPRPCAFVTCSMKFAQSEFRRTHRAWERGYIVLP